MKIIKSVLGIGLLVGGSIAAFIWLFLLIMEKAIHLIWETIPEVMGINYEFYTVFVFLIGGIVIGFCQVKLGRYPKDMHSVIGEFKLNGRVEYAGVLWKYVICAILPLIFGGAIGPEAGLFGAIAMIITFVAERLKAKNYERQMIEASFGAVLTAVLQVPIFNTLTGVEGEASSLKKNKVLNWITYVVTILTTWFVYQFLNRLIGKESFIFKMEASEIVWSNLLLIVPAIGLAILIAEYYVYLERGIKFILEKMKLADNYFWLAVAGSLVMGLIAAMVPAVKFSGEHELKVLVHDAALYSAGALILLGFLKMLMTKICLNVGFIGGQIFPLVFASFAIGIGLGQIFEVGDQTLAIAIFGVAILAAILKKPLGIVILTGLFFPPIYWPIIGVSAFGTSWVATKIDSYFHLDKNII